MIEIFVPVLFLCLNGNCNFMQGSSSYKTDAQCRVSVDNQKQYMIELADKSNQGKITALEGTCINFKIESRGKQI